MEAGCWGNGTKSMEVGESSSSLYVNTSSGISVMKKSRPGFAD